MRPQLKADYFDAETQLFIVSLSANDNYIIPIDAVILADDTYEYNCYLIRTQYKNCIYTCEYRKI